MVFVDYFYFGIDSIVLLWVGEVLFWKMLWGIWLCVFGILFCCLCWFCCWLFVLMMVWFMKLIIFVNMWFFWFVNSCIFGIIRLICLWLFFGCWFVCVGMIWELVWKRVGLRFIGCFWVFLLLRLVSGCMWLKCKFVKVLLSWIVSWLKVWGNWWGFFGLRMVNWFLLLNWLLVLLMWKSECDFVLFFIVFCVVVVLVGLVVVSFGYDRVGWVCWVLFDL